MSLSERLLGARSVFPTVTLSQRQRNLAFSLIFMIPAIVFIGILVIVPVAFTFYLSVTDATLLSQTQSFIGLDNYTQLFQSSDFKQSIWLAIIFAASTVVFQIVLGLAFALALNRDFRGASVARTLAIAPYLVPTIVVALMWKWMLHPITGVVNKYLVHFGVVESGIPFFGTTELAMPTLVMASSWKFIAFAVIVFLARLQAIDETMYEQAQISGASVIQRFWSITLPNLRSAILLVVLLRFIWMFNKFDIIWLLTSGGPVESTTTLPVYIYRITFLRTELALGSAAAINLFVFLVAAATVYFWAFRPSQELGTRG